MMRNPNILEIGTGYGRVSQALRIMYPNANIIGYDYDDSVGIKRMARKNGITLVSEDITLVSLEELNSLIRSNNIGYVVGLETSGRVASYLLSGLTDIGFYGNFGFSLITMVEERDHLNNLHMKLGKLHSNNTIHYLKIPLDECSEIGYAITYSI